MRCKFRKPFSFGWRKKIAFRASIPRSLYPRRPFALLSTAEINLSSLEHGLAFSGPGFVALHPLPVGAGGGASTSGSSYLDSKLALGEVRAALLGLLQHSGLVLG